MIKRTLFFGSPAHLSTRNQQLVYEPRPTAENENPEPVTVPIEDVGLVIMEHPQITLSQALLSQLIENQAAVVCCDSKLHPAGLFLPLSGHTEQGGKFRSQLEASQPLKKMLWQQLVTAKIKNQAQLLARHDKPADQLWKWSEQVKSGDVDNREARAAAHYWKHFFPSETRFVRDRGGSAPNNLLNYGYAILRALTARSLVASGLLPAIGLFHKNRYNAYPLADDVMEPWRPFVDALVLRIVLEEGAVEQIEKHHKQLLLSIATVDVMVEGEMSPLMVGLTRCTASLAKCFEGVARKMVLPSWPDGTV